MGENNLQSDYNQLLNKFDNSILSGKYYEVLEEIEQFLKNKEISTEDKIRAKIQKGRIFIHLSGFEFIFEYNNKALDILNEAYNVSIDKQFDFLAYDAIYWKYLPFWGLNRYDEYLTTNDEFNLLQEEIKSKDPSLTKLVKSRSLVWKFFENAIRNYNENKYVMTTIEFIDLQLESLKISVELGDQEEIIFRQRQIALCYQMHGNFEQSLLYWNKLLKLHLDTGNKSFTANTYYNIARQYRHMGYLDKYYEFLKKADKAYNEVKSKRGIAYINQCFGDYFNLKGEREKAFDYFEKGLQFYQEINDKMMIGWSLNNCGEIYQQKGELNKALDYFKKAFRIFIELGRPNYVQINVNTNDIHFNISVVQYLKGEFDDAIEIRKDLLDRSRNEQIIDREAIYLTSLAEVFLQKGKTKEAYDYVKESLAIREEIGDTFGICNSLYLLILIAFESNDKELAKKYLEQLQPVVNELRSKPWNQKYQYLKALVLKMSNVISDRIQAEVLLEQLLKEELNYKLLTGTLFSLCELLILELKESSVKEILEKILKYVNELHNFAKLTNSYTLIIETLWLQSQLALLELNVKKAEDLLSQANLIAEKRGLERLRLKISNDKMKLDNKTVKLNKLEKSTLSKRLEIVELEKTVTDIINERLKDFNVDEPIIGAKLFKLKL